MTNTDTKHVKGSFERKLLDITKKLQISCEISKQN